MLLFQILRFSLFLSPSLKLTIVIIRAPPPTTVFSGDQVVRLLLLWGLFMPLGARYSVDHLIKQWSRASHTSSSKDVSKRAVRLPLRFWFPASVLRASSTALKAHQYMLERNVYAGMGVLILAAQLFALYLNSAHVKTGAEWQATGYAVWYALSLDFFRLPMGTWLLHHISADTLGFLGKLTLYWEEYGGWLYVCPFFPLLLRNVGAFGWIFMHLGFAVSLRLAQFFWIGITGHMALFTTWFWNAITWIVARVFSKGR